MDINVPMNYPRKRRLMIQILKKADNIVSNSHYTMKRIVRLGINEDKIVVVFPCPGFKVKEASVKRKEIAKQYDIGDKQVLLTLGRLVQRKGIDNVIEALSQVKNVYDKFIYLIVGKGPDKDRITSLVKNHDMEDNVKIVGYAKDSELPTFYSACDMFITTPREIGGDVEGFGIVYLEANSFGKPVIASRTGGVIEAVLDNQTGILVDQGDIQQIRDAILKLLRNDSLRKSLGDNGRKRVKDKFQWELQVKKLNQLLQEKN